jgi:hypothetical protein
MNVSFYGFFLRTHFINIREMRSYQKRCWQGVRRVA